MAAKRKPNISNKPKIAEVKRVDPVVIPKSEPTKTQYRSKQTETKGIGLLFDKRNYILMLIGIAFIIIGFVTMAGGGSNDPKVFNEDIFDAQRLTVAPILILLGFAIEVVAIMLKPKQKAEA
ncbi:MAG: DUF3098 domain-containing protein [Bacteroidota bacterium]